jgi:hypothetical protein
MKRRGRPPRRRGTLDGRSVFVVWLIAATVRLAICFGVPGYAGWVGHGDLPTREDEYRRLSDEYVRLRDASPPPQEELRVLREKLRGLQDELRLYEEFTPRRGDVLVLAGTWAIVWVALILYVVRIHGIPWRDEFRFPPAWTFAVILVASWPLSLLHAGEVALWRLLPIEGITGPGGSGIVFLLEAAKSGPDWLRLPSVASVVAMAVLQVVLFFGLDKPTESEGRQTRVLAGHIALVILFLCFDSAGFPATTTAALAVAYSLTRSVIAPITLVVGLCVSLWL